MALPWVVGLGFQSLGHSVLQQTKLYEIYLCIDLIFDNFDGVRLYILFLYLRLMDLVFGW